MTVKEDYLPALKEVLEEVKKHNMMLSARIENDIKGINEKVFDHDKSLTLIAKVMEDINSNFATFTATVSSIQKENTEFQKQYHDAQYKHWKAQDEINFNINAILSNMSKIEPKIHGLEQSISSLNTESAVREVTDTDISKRLSSVESWQTWALRALISNAVVAIGSLLMIIYNTLIK